MFSAGLVLLQLLWLSLASASHFYGSVVTYTTKTGLNGNYEVELRIKVTYDGCYFHYGSCYSGNCGSSDINDKGQIDYSSNSPKYNSRWCQTETIITKTLASNRPFQIREYSCCWIRLSPGHYPHWSILTTLDLGKRSDTSKPNNSPAAAILPFLRVPQNCRRTYKLLSFDPDGDKVRCRYGTAKYTECYECSKHSGFQLDQDTCALQYLASSNQGVYGFELVVEDFPHQTVNMFYSDGSSSFRYAVNNRRKRAVTTPPTSTTAAPYTNTPTTTTYITTAPVTTSTTTPAFTTAHYHYSTASFTSTTAPVITTTAPFTTTTGAATTTPPPTSTTAHYHYSSAPLTTTTNAPVTATTAPFATTTGATTTAPTSTTAHYHYSTAPLTTTTTAPVTASTAPFATTTSATTTAPTSTTAHYHYSTAPLTTTTTAPVTATTAPFATTTSATTTPPPTSTTAHYHYSTAPFTTTTTAPFTTTTTSATTTAQTSTTAHYHYSTAPLTTTTTAPVTATTAPFATTTSATTTPPPTSTTAHYHYSTAPFTTTTTAPFTTTTTSAATTTPPPTSTTAHYHYSTAPFTTTTTAPFTTTTSTTTPTFTTAHYHSSTASSTAFVPTAATTTTATTTPAFTTSLYAASTPSFTTTNAITATTTTAPAVTTTIPITHHHHIPNTTPASPSTASMTTISTSTVTRAPVFVFLSNTTTTYTTGLLSTPSKTTTISALPSITYMTTTATTHPSTLVTFSSPYWGVPFSQLPLQFTFQVDPPAPSCTEGEYLPKYVYPTPLHGVVLMAEARKEIEIKVKAVANYSVPDDIIMSGPLNVTKHRTTADEFTIRWTPIDENMGHYFPICFAVEFTYGSAIFQTEMRCVIVKVTTGLGQVNTVVTCLESSMIVEVEKATLPELHYEHLRLSDPSNTACSLYSNSTHVVAHVPLNACGTQIEEDADDLFFKNEIITVDNTSVLITRKHLFEIKFFCQYSKRGNVTATFSAHRENVTVWDKGLGKFTYGFEFFPDQRFVSRIDPRLYPLEYDVGDRIFMEIEATTTVNNTELFVESCRAAPYDNPNYAHPYTLIENGCNLDSTLTVYPSSNKKEFKFSIEAFKFIGLHDKVYISCSVLMCEAGNPSTRCSHGCLPNAPRRVRREAAIESGIHYVSQGPLRLKRSVQAENTGLSLNLVFVTGCALAAVGMICGVLLYKTKNSGFKYQLLSSEEN